jgi:hypothetical protein
MSAREHESLVEQAVTAWRPRGPRGELRPHPAWSDLDAAGREEVFRATLLQRALEVALDPQGLSTTAKAVLARLPGMRDA